MNGVEWLREVYANDPDIQKEYPVRAEWFRTFDVVDAYDPRRTHVPISALTTEENVSAIVPRDDGKLYRRKTNIAPRPSDVPWGVATCKRCERKRTVTERHVNFNTGMIYYEGNCDVCGDWLSTKKWWME